MARADNQEDGTESTVQGWVGTRKGALVALLITGVLVASGCATLGRYGPSRPATGPVLRSFVFPVAAGKASYSDTFGAPRSGGRTHEGQDLMAAKHTPVVAAADGTITSVTWSSAGLSGNALRLTDTDGWVYVYIHLNNDTPGTDDGSNVYERAFADGIATGQKVKAGEVIGWVGDSGNAEGTSPHLHFELHRPDGAVVNAYSSLAAASKMVRTEAERLADSPLGSLDAVAREADGSVRVTGWALDARVNDPVKVSVYVNGSPVATATANQSRPDVAATYGRGALHGASVGAVAAPTGAAVCLVARSVGGGGSSRVGCTTAP